VINETEFLAMGIPSYKVVAILEDIGESEILVTRGIKTSVTFDGVMLSVGLNDRNPFEFEGYACYIDSNLEIWLGIEVEPE
jgi:hypothetical protein